MNVSPDINNLFNRLEMNAEGQYHEFDRKFQETPPEKLNLDSRVSSDALSASPGDASDIPPSTDSDVDSPAVHPDHAVAAASPISVMEQKNPQASVAASKKRAAPRGSRPISRKWEVLQTLSGTSATALGHDAPNRNPCIAVFSPLGGAGTSAMAAGIAWSMSHAGWSPLLVDLGEMGMAQLFLSVGGTVLAETNGWKATLSHFPGSSKKTVLLSAAPQGAETLATLVTDRGGMESPEMAQIFGHLEDQKCCILDIPAGRADLYQKLAPQLDFVVVPLRADLAAMLAVREMQRDGGNGPFMARSLPHLYVLNQFDSENPLQEEIARNLSRSLGPLLAPVSIPRDPGLNEAVADGHPFSSPFFRRWMGDMFRLLPISLRHYANF